MHTERTNLLPKSAIRSLRRSYFFRLATVATVLALLLLLVHGILLIPTYLYTVGEVKRETTQLATLSASFQSSSEGAIQKRINEMRSDASYLATLGELPTGSSAIAGILTVAHPGIHLYGFTFTAPVTATSSAKMTVSGRASTRDTLRQYALSLGALPYVENADLPISAYAKEKDIDFTISITGRLKP